MIIKSYKSHFFGQNRCQSVIPPLITEVKSKFCNKGISTLDNKNQIYKEMLLIFNNDRDMAILSRIFMQNTTIPILQNKTLT